MMIMRVISPNMLRPMTEPGWQMERGILLQSYTVWQVAAPNFELYGSEHNVDSHGNVQALMKHNNFLCLHHFMFSQSTKYFQETHCQAAADMA